jgi:hypothetical protein
MPILPVFVVTNGVPGRGLVADAGVDSSTGMFGAAVPRIVTETVAFVTVGFGVNDTDGEGAGVDDELPPQSDNATAKPMTEIKIANALGMARTVRRMRQRLR